MLFVISFAKIFLELTGGSTLMKIRLLSTVILILTFASGVSVAQERVIADWARALDRTDLNWTGSGVRARSMGGAFISIADDGSAITWNPAGLIQTLDPQISFSGTFTRPRDTYSLSYKTAPGGEYVVDDDKWMIDYAAFLAPIKISGRQFSASIAYQRLTNIARATWLNPGVVVLPTFHNDYDNEHNWLDIVPTRHEVWSTGSIDVVNLGFGTDVIDNLSFGMSANILFGNSEEGYDIEAEWDAVVGVGGSAEDRKRMFRGHSLSEMSHSGFNLTFGLQYRLEKLRLGMVLKTPFELKSEWDAIQNDTVWEYDPTDGKGYIMPPSATPGWKKDRILVDQKQKIEIPVTIGFGASYQVSPSFLISGDVEWRRFGTSERSRLDSVVVKVSGEREEFFTPLPLNYYNAGEGRFGFEYNLETDNGTIPLRGGFKYVQHYLSNSLNLLYPATDEVVDAGVPTIYERNVSSGVLSSYWSDVAGDRITGFGFSLGTGIHWDRIWLDAMFEYYTDSRDVSGVDGREIEMVEFAPVGHTKFTGEDKYETIAIVVEFTGYF
jgi:long-subunit fatty acid transport protein